MFTIVEVQIKKFSVFPSKFGSEENGAKAKNCGISMEVDGDLTMNEGNSIFLIGGCNEESTKVLENKKLFFMIETD